MQTMTFLIRISGKDRDTLLKCLLCMQYQRMFFPLNLQSGTKMCPLLRISASRSQFDPSRMPHVGLCCPLHLFRKQARDTSQVKIGRFLKNHAQHKHVKQLLFRILFLVLHHISAKFILFGHRLYRLPKKVVLLG